MAAQIPSVFIWFLNEWSRPCSQEIFFVSTWQISKRTNARGFSLLWVTGNSVRQERLWKDWETNEKLLPSMANHNNWDNWHIECPGGTIWEVRVLGSKGFEKLQHKLGQLESHAHNLGRTQAEKRLEETSRLNWAYL